MKKIALYLVLGISILSSCSSNNNNTEQHDHDNHNHDHSATQITPDFSTIPLGDAFAKYDPVCDMEVQDNWTIHGTYEGYDVHYCSETCKEAFEGNPGKYTAKYKQ